MLDLITPIADWPFWVGAVFVTAVLVSTYMVDIKKLNPELSKGDYYGFRAVMIIIMLAFWFVPLGLIPLTRNSANNRIAYTIGNAENVRVMFDGVEPVSETDVAIAWSGAVAEWEKAATLEGWDSGPLADNVWLIFKPLPFMSHGKTGFFAGLTFPMKSVVLVGIGEEGIEKSALGHEVGHLILYRQTGNGSETKLKSYRDKYGVPY